MIAPELWTTHVRRILRDEHRQFTTLSDATRIAERLWEFSQGWHNQDDENPSGKAEAVPR